MAKLETVVTAFAVETQKNIRFFALHKSGKVVMFRFSTLSSAVNCHRALLNSGNYLRCKAWAAK